MAYNKQNNQALKGRLGRPNITQDMVDDLDHTDNEIPDLTIDNPEPPLDEIECVCIYHYRLRGYFTCTKDANGVIDGYDFFGKEYEISTCEPPDGGRDGRLLKYPGDHYIETETEEDWENCVFSFDHFEAKHLGPCLMCWCSKIASRTLSEHRSGGGPLPDTIPDPLWGDRSPWNPWYGDIEGDPGRFFWHLLTDRLSVGQSEEIDKGCCERVIILPPHKAFPPEALDHIGIPFVDRLKSFELARKGQRSLVTGTNPNFLASAPKSTAAIQTQTGTNRGRFVLKGSAGLIQYYKGDVVTFAGKTYSVLEDVKGKHPSNDSSFLLIEDKNSGVDGGIY